MQQSTAQTAVDLRQITAILALAGPLPGRLRHLNIPFVRGNGHNRRCSLTSDYRLIFSKAIP